MSSEKIEKVDFNEYAENYEKVLQEDLNFFGEENGYFAEYKVKTVKEITGDKPVRILEYGCGIGLNLRYFRTYFPGSEISGCDISEKSVQIARDENSRSELFLITKDNLEKRKGYYDLIFVSCVFHHIAPALREEAITNIKDLLKPDGLLFIFEHNPYNPVTRKIVRDCVWDKDAILLKMSETKDLMKAADFEILQDKYTLFFPAAFSFFRPLEKLLGYIPMGGQYFVQGKKPSDS